MENLYRQIDLIVEESFSITGCKTEAGKIEKLFEKANTFIEGLGFRFVADAYKHIITSPDKYLLSTSRFPYSVIRYCIEDGIKSGEFSPDCDPGEVTELCMRIGRGMIFDWCLHDGKFPLAKESRKTIALYLKSIKNRSRKKRRQKKA